MEKKRDTYQKVRDILGSEVYKNLRTKKEYLVTYSKTGKPNMKLLK